MYLEFIFLCFATFQVEWECQCVLLLRQQHINIRQFLRERGFFIFYFFEKEREGRVNTISNILFLLCTNLNIFMFEKTH